MSNLCVDALTTLAGRGDLPLLGDGQSWLAVCPPAGWTAPNGAGLVYSPWVRGEMGVPVVADLSESRDFPYVYVFPEKDQDAARGQLALAIRACAPAGVVVAVAANDSGGRRLEAACAAFGVRVLGSHAKHHARVVVVAPSPDMDMAAIEAAILRATRPSVGPEGFVTLPGLHSDAAVDAGSALLASHLPPSLCGTGADFGCGWGYLSVHVLQNCAGVDGLHALDADARALVCVQQNVVALVPARAQALRTGWVDLARAGGDRGPFDFIVMNPPFHTGKATVPALGQAMITTAAASLRAGGTLYLVANRHLPYESVMAPLFTRVDLLSQTPGFKVYRAVKA